MATIKTGVCPVCLKDRQLAKFEFGIVKTTLCPHCLKKYLDTAIIPRIVINNDLSEFKATPMLEKYFRNLQKHQNDYLEQV